MIEPQMLRKSLVLVPAAMLISESQEIFHMLRVLKTLDFHWNGPDF